MRLKRRQKIYFGLIGLFLLLGSIGWKAYRTVRQEHRNQQLIAAIKNDPWKGSRIAEVRACLQRGADPNALDVPSQAPLSWKRLLLLLGLRKDTSPSGQTALLLAQEGEMRDLEDCCLHSADPDIPDMVKLLLRYGADVKAKDRFGRTALVAAFNPAPYSLRSGMLEGVGPNMACELALIAAGADVNARDEDGRTALMVGNYRDSVAELDKALLRRGANINARSKDGTTALIVRVQNQDSAGCRFLLEHGADVNADANGQMALHYAANSGDEALVDLLLRYGAKVNMNIGPGQTPLMMAAQSGHTTILRKLLQHGSDIDAHDLNGWTALTYAAIYNKEACVRLLFDNGATVYLPGTTLAQEMQGFDGARNSRLVDLLKAHGMRE